MRLKEHSYKDVTLKGLYGALSEHPHELNKYDFTQIIETTEVWERKATFHSLVDEIRNNKLAPETLIYFVRFEPNAKLAHRATSEFIRLKSCSISNEFAGVEQILDLYKNEELQNAGAVLAGLLCLGDRRVNALLRALRSEFSAETLQEFTRIHPAHLCSASIEFYFDWIFELQRKQDTTKLNAVCAAMTVMLFHDETGFVEDHSELTCVGFKFPALQRKSYLAYYDSIEPTLNKLRQVNLKDNPSVQVLISTWENHRQTSVNMQSSQA